MKKLLAVAFAVCMAVAAQAAGYSDISLKDLKQSIDAKKVTLLDANGTESYKEGHIPGAIDFEAKKAELAKVLPKDKDALIVAYCGGPGCNAYQAAAKAAEKLGYKNIKHFSGGLSGWDKAGEKLVAQK